MCNIKLIYTWWYCINVLLDGQNWHKSAIFNLCKLKKLLNSARVAPARFLFRTPWRTNINHKTFPLTQCTVMLKNATGLQVWSPHQKYLITKIERVQHKFLNYLYFGKSFPGKGVNLDYSNLCQYFNIQSVQSRRKLLDAVFLYKCLNGSFNSMYIVANVPFHVPSWNLRPHYTFKMARFNSTQTKNSFLPRPFIFINTLQNVDMLSR